MSSNEEYLRAMEKDKDQFAQYFLKHLKEKSEQQKYLEKLLAADRPAYSASIADVACGAGTLTYHMNKFFPDAEFFLIDINVDAIQKAKEVLKNVRASFSDDSIYDLSAYREKFDLVFCWQTLSWLDRPELALQQLVNSTKKGGRIYLSSLFNLHHDVDVYSNVFDYTRPSGKESIPMPYNTYSAYSIEKWLRGKVSSYRFHEFIPDIDFKFDGRGIGTYTIDTKEKGRLQVSAGMLMNWSILEITK